MAVAPETRILKAWTMIYYAKPRACRELLPAYKSPAYMKLFTNRRRGPYILFGVCTSVSSRKLYDYMGCD